jgi:protein-S-isoprenylcysteine O-methyltransferase Ste14
MVVVTPTLRASALGRAFAVIGGLLFAASLLYFLLRYHAFGEHAGPWTSAGWTAVLFNVTLFSAFALHHSVFARTGVKNIISASVSEALERVVYVWISSLLFVLTLWAWMPVPGTVWETSGPVSWILSAGQLAGVILTLVAASALDPLELAGVRQAFGLPLKSDRSLTTAGAYGIVRHPIYLGWVLLVWSVPVMTGSRFVFAAISTLYLVLAVPFEERQLRRSFGEPYDAYARVVRWRMIPGVY